MENTQLGVVRQGGLPSHLLFPPPWENPLWLLNTCLKDVGGKSASLLKNVVINACWIRAYELLTVVPLSKLHSAAWARVSGGMLCSSLPPLQAAPMTETEDFTYANLKFEKKGTKAASSSDVVYTEIKPLQQKQSSGDAVVGGDGCPGREGEPGGGRDEQPDDCPKN